MINIKVCGLTSVKQLQQLDGLDIDFAGFIFSKDSPRYAGDKIAGKELKTADFDIKKTGVFVDAGFEEIMRTVAKYGLDLVQLHGNESAKLCAEVSAEIEVIKAFHISAETDSIDSLLGEFDDACDYYLFDTAVNGKSGGTGEKFDWKKLSDSKIEKPFFISGGIGPGDVPAIKKFKHPDFFGVDINSRFEKEPGIKDMGEILKFQRTVR